VEDPDRRDVGAARGRPRAAGHHRLRLHDVHLASVQPARDAPDARGLHLGLPLARDGHGDAPIRDQNLQPVGQPFDFLSTFQNTAVIRQYGIGQVIAGLGVQPAGWVTLNNHPESIRRISHPAVVYDRSNPFAAGECEVVPLYDLGAVDIVRERERGLPKIGQYWRNIGLGQYAPTQWMNIANTADQASILGDLYGWNIENVDFVVGMMGQNSLPIDGLPQVSSAGFIPFVISRAYSDRFLTSAGFTPASYTQWGLARLFGTGAPGSHGVSLAQIIVENGILPLSTIPNPAAIFKVWPASS